MSTNDDTFNYWCALYNILPFFGGVFIFLILMIVWTTRHIQYKTIKGTIVSVVEGTQIPEPLFFITTPPPLHQKDNIDIKKYEISYTENEKNYIVIMEGRMKFNVGEKIDIRIKRTDPTKYSFSDDTVVFYFMWIVMILFLLMARKLYNQLNTPNGSRFLCWVLTFWRILKKDSDNNNN